MRLVLSRELRNRQRGLAEPHVLMTTGKKTGRGRWDHATALGFGFGRVAAIPEPTTANHIRPLTRQPWRGPAAVSRARSFPHCASLRHAAQPLQGRTMPPLPKPSQMMDMDEVQHGSFVMCGQDMAGNRAQGCVTASSSWHCPCRALQSADQRNGLSLCLQIYKYPDTSRPTAACLSNTSVLSTFCIPVQHPRLLSSSTSPSEAICSLLKPPRVLTPHHQISFASNRHNGLLQSCRPR